MEYSKKHRKWRRLCMRFSDGGSAPAGAKPEETPASSPESQPGSSAKAYTEEDLAAAKTQAVEEYKHHLEEAQDYDKMTPEEKVAYLEAQREQDKIVQYATAQLAHQELPVELLRFVKGKDEAETDQRIRDLWGVVDKAVQAGVEKRFRQNGYLPRHSAAGTPAGEPKKRDRGVSVE